MPKQRKLEIAVAARRAEIAERECSESLRQEAIGMNICPDCAGRTVDLKKNLVDLFLERTRTRCASCNAEFDYCHAINCHGV